MQHDGTDDFSGLDLVEGVLRGLGSQDAVLDRRGVNAESWFTDWSGLLKGADVYIGIMWASTGSRTARLLLDDWVFEDVPMNSLGDLIAHVFNGTAAIKSRLTFFRRSRILALEVPVDGGLCVSQRRAGVSEELSRWELRLTVE
ncbi:hypothetical protein [Streptomyces sp. NPDC093109]|uniref:hypothetical protein n=1 Tax=Streptomyces sp. NPDC093109 TaxID=3154977 RepID=UPI00344B6AF5